VRLALPGDARHLTARSDLTLTSSQKVSAEPGKRTARATMPSWTPPPGSKRASSGIGRP